MARLCAKTLAVWSEAAEEWLPIELFERDTWHTNLPTTASQSDLEFFLSMSFTCHAGLNGGEWYRTCWCDGKRCTKTVPLPTRA